MTTSTEPATGVPVVRIINTLAAVLGHGCALPDAEAARLPSLRAWCAASTAAAIAYNDSLPAAQKWMTCPEGWGGQWEQNAAGSRWWSCGWQTATGRLTVGADGGGPGGPFVALAFTAGPPSPTAAPRGVADLEWSPGDGWRAAWCDPTLIVGREDRLAILHDLDRALGGQVGADLTRWAAHRAGRTWQSASAAVLAALETLADRDRRAREEWYRDHPRPGSSEEVAP